MQPLFLLPILLFSILLLSPAQTQGEVLNIVDIKDKFVVNETNLKMILSKITPDTQIGVFSIAGEIAKEKSFILNFFLQYLQNLSAHSGDVFKKKDVVLFARKLKDAIKNQDDPWLRDIQRNFGLQFKSGLKRETRGIDVWSEPLNVPGKSGNGIAILLMDSQFQQNLYEKEPRKWCEKGYCMAVCNPSFLECRTTEGSRWDGEFVRCNSGADCSGYWKCAEPCHF